MLTLTFPRGHLGKIVDVVKGLEKKGYVWLVPLHSYQKLDVGQGMRVAYAGIQ